MDIKAKIQEIVGRLQGDAGLRSQFMSEPVKAVASLLGVDLPDDVVNQITEGVKAKLAADSLSGAADKLKGLFGK